MNKHLTMRIKIKSIKICIEWWQLAVIIVLAILAISVPELVVALLEKRR